MTKGDQNRDSDLDYKGLFLSTGRVEQLAEELSEKSHG
jgi:hypothetical protein